MNTSHSFEETSIKKQNLVVTRVLDASVNEVWRAWSDGDYVMRWWGPKGFTCPLARMDFREGGTSLVCMLAPKQMGGMEMFNTWTYQKIVSNERIEYILRFTDKDGEAFNPSERGFPPGIPKEVPHVNTFKDLGNGKTELVITEFGYDNKEVVEISRQGLEQCLDKMAAIFAGN
jgi:uncharacterized protein YndB with AHSA1/START domain